MEAATTSFLSRMRSSLNDVIMSNAAGFRILAAFLVVLLLLLASATMLAIDRAEHSMSRLLGEKGSSLLTVCESILRSGMRHEIGVRLQVLLEEMATSNDILFAAVIMPDGTILAHSDGSRPGEILQIDGRDASPERIAALAPSITTQWRFMQVEGRMVFSVYRFFTPGFRHLPEGLSLPIIVLGLDPSPFEITRRQNNTYISMLAVISLLVVLAGFSALFFAQRARESKVGQEQALGRVQQLEEEVRRKEKLAAIGSLAAGVAHEIRNPLSSIKGYATYFATRFPEGSEDRASCESMVGEVNRLNRVITELIGLSRPSDIVCRPVSPSDIISGVTRLLSADARNQGVILRTRLSAGLPKVFADRERLHQALLNLCLNALQAMSGGDSLTLGAAEREGRVSFLVRDTGAGIPKSVLPHIFDPYFTTRSQGTGLGLALVHKIVDAHGGSITVRSKEASGGRGWTLFCITLPAYTGGEDHVLKDIAC
ncbi:MAG: two-component system sensor histidine kinase ZraS [Desulfovibrio sp.]|nr:two-component system sensor histidine kinase ZraS [Desulfovibrio sp.]